MRDSSAHWKEVLLLIVLVVPLIVPPVGCAGDVAPILYRQIAENPEGIFTVWIAFESRSVLDRDLAALLEVWCRRSLERRAKARKGSLLNQNDLPVNREGVKRVTEMGIRVRVHSRWLNAVSAEIPGHRVRSIASLPMVRSVAPVASYHRPRVEKADPPKRESDDSMYGPGFGQVDQIQVPVLHSSYGLSGQGVRIALLDTRFDRDHEALQHVRVYAEWDFVGGDPTASYEDGDPGGPGAGHGTQTLSTIAGYRWGQLIGPAYGADYVLARTEDSSDEQAVEEDYWVAGLEWAESLGVDILSSSLGYNAWYSQDDMDGNTAVVTRVADRAAAAGLLVVNSAGNEANNSWGTIIAPADGDSVLAVGAVYNNGVRVGFSSLGPTADGRIKPDVMAQGASNYVASDTDMSGYEYANGTSFAAPLVAGLAALLLEAHPEWTPGDLMAALRSTATRAGAPDNHYGWGICQGLGAVQWTPGAPAMVAPEVRLASPNPFRPGDRVWVAWENPGEVTVLGVYDCLGRLLARTRMSPGQETWIWDATDQDGRAVAPGVYFVKTMGLNPDPAHKIVLVR
ncbi:MAG: S8 family serine peptidase [Candidatus Eisenbacteria sp.]|nr:S8 family serine peptidase [Candidatus Eisenbacteria bacterium]